MGRTVGRRVTSLSAESLGGGSDQNTTCFQSDLGECLLESSAEFGERRYGLEHDRYLIPETYGASDVLTGLGCQVKLDHRAESMAGGELLESREQYSQMRGCDLELEGVDLAVEIDGFTFLVSEGRTNGVGGRFDESFENHRERRRALLSLTCRHGDLVGPLDRSKRLGSSFLALEPDDGGRQA